MAEVESNDSATDRSRVKLVVLVLLIAGGILLARFTFVGEILSREGVGQAVEWLQGSRWAPIIFVAAYATATALAVPGTILTLAGGAVFGVFWGTIFNSIAANLGANAAFLIARGLGRESIRGFLGKNSTALEKMDRVVGAHGFQGLLTLRLIPLVPFNALNFGSGLLPIRWATYATATLIGIFPGTLVYTFFADALLQGSQEASREALIRVLIAGGLLVVLSFTPAILKRLNVRLPGMSGLVLLVAASLVSAVPEPAWGQEQGAPAMEVPLVDHTAFSRVLAGTISPEGVDYEALSQRRESLDAYLEGLAAVDEELLAKRPASQQLSFWINAYNACMLKRVLDHYPIRRAGGILGLKNRIAGRPANSVWQIKDVFTAPHCAVGGRARSQDEIEHSIIRPMGEPRIHFAVNCAAKSCPPLTATAFLAATLDQQLDERVQAFIEDPQQFSIREGEGKIVLNEILTWFQEDFGGPAGVRRFFSAYLDGSEAAAMLDESLSLESTPYDWSLNDRNP